MLAKLGLLTLANVKEVAEVINRILDWSPGRWDEEVERTVNLLKENHGVLLKNE